MDMDRRLQITIKQWNSDANVKNVNNVIQIDRKYEKIFENKTDKENFYQLTESLCCRCPPCKYCQANNL